MAIENAWNEWDCYTLTIDFLQLEYETFHEEYAASQTKKLVIRHNTQSFEKTMINNPGYDMIWYDPILQKRW
jgi:hypothetical protein